MRVLVLADHRLFRLMVQDEESDDLAAVTERSHPSGNGLPAEHIVNVFADQGLGRIQKANGGGIAAEDVARCGCHQERHRQELKKRADFGLDHGKELLALIRARHAQTTSGSLHPARIRQAP